MKRGSLAGPRVELTAECSGAPGFLASTTTFSEAVTKADTSTNVVSSPYQARMKPSNLSREIDELLASRTLPADLAHAVDAIRAVGNFAAQPLKSTNAGLVLDVEPGEAELLLNVLEELFEFYFVRPAELQAKLDAANKKLADAGKPPLERAP